MKKIARLITALALMTYAFTSCEDIPAPFNTSGSQTDVIKVDPAGEGTKANPFNVSGIINYTKELANGASTAEVYVTGYVVNIREFQQQYSSLNYDIADDIEGKSEYFYVYGGKGLNKAAFNSIADLPISAKVTICGKVKNHNGVIEFDSQNYIVELDGKTSGGDSDAEAKGTGTLEDPFNAVAATQEAQKLESGAVSEKAYYIKGKVSKIATDKSGNVLNFDQGTYGNASFYISDDGEAKNDFYCYRVLYLGNKKWTSGAGDVLKVGDDVIVCAKLTMYNSTPETQQNEGYLYSLNGKTEEGGGSQGSGSNYGTAEAPLTVAQAMALIDAESTISEAYVKGKISQIDSYNATYKSITYWISDDGGTTTQLQVYSGKGLNGADFTAKEDLTLGKTVVVKGALKKYNTTYEFDKTSSIISIDGESGGGSQGSGSNYGTATSPLTVAQAIALIDAESNISEAYVKGKISKVDSYNETYKSITYWISDDGTTATQLQVYSGKGLNGADFSSKDDLTVGKTVVIKGALKKFNTTYEFDKTSSIISIEDEGGGGSTPTTGGDIQVVTVAQFNAAAESTSVWYKLTGTIKNLKEGDKYGNFDLEDETGSVYVYGLLSEKGGQKQKFQELVTAKGLANGKTITIVGNRGSYSGKVEVMNAYFVSVE